MEKEREKKIRNNKSIGLTILFIASPVIASLILLCAEWILYKTVSLPCLKWNDEAVYVKLSESYSKFVFQKGFWGFNTNHAIVGKGPAWNIASIWPYAIWAMIFPTGQTFVYVLNMFYITLANGLFVLLTKPTKIQKIKLIIAELSGAAFLLYLNTNMSEMFRFSLVIVIAGLIYRVWFLKCPKWLKYIAAPIFIVYAAQVYTFFVFCVPVYVFALLKDTKLWKKLTAAFASFTVVSVGSYLLLHFVSSNYNIGKPDKVINALKSGNVFEAMKNGLYLVYDGLSGLWNLKYTVYTNGIYVFHVLMALMVVAIGLMLFLSRKASAKDKAIGLCVSYSVLIFGFMYITLYTIVPDTFLRGTEIVMIFSLVMLAVTDDSRKLAFAVLIVNAVSLCFLPISMKSFGGEERYMTRAQRLEQKYFEDNLSSVFEISDSGNPWDNTILVYTMEPAVITALPNGFGVNFIMEEIFTDEAGYLVFSEVNHERPGWVETDYQGFMDKYGETINENYEEIYSDGEYICYKKRKN